MADRELELLERIRELERLVAEKNMVIMILQKHNALWQQQKEYFRQILEVAEEELARERSHA